MSKKFLSSLAALFALAVFGPSQAWAQTALDKVAGYAPSGETIFAPGAVAADGYTIGLIKQFGVSFESSVGQLRPFRGPFLDKPTGKNVWHYAIPNGSTVYAMPLGSAWGEMSEELMQIDVKKAKSSSTSSGGAANFRFAKGSLPCEMVTWVVVNADGTRFWGSHPDGSPYVVLNNATSPRTGWCVPGNQVITVDRHDPAIRPALAQKK